MFVRNYTRKHIRDRKDKAEDDTSPAEKTYGDEDSGQDGYFSWNQMSTLYMFTVYSIFIYHSF